MTQQEVFDKVAAHLLKQGVQSRGFRGGFSSSCLYRGQDGTSCAVGCLIKDEVYRPSLEGHLSYAPGVREALEASGVPIMGNSELSRLLSSLQDVHDRFTPDRWRSELKKVAFVFKLSVDSLKPALV